MMVFSFLAPSNNNKNDSLSYPAVQAHMETIASSQWNMKPSILQYRGASTGRTRRSAIIHTTYAGMQYMLFATANAVRHTIRAYRLKQQGTRRSLHRLAPTPAAPAGPAASCTPADRTRGRATQTQPVCDTETTGRGAG